jgi:hypothetical protein
MIWDYLLWLATLGGILVLLWAVAVWPEVERKEEDE